MNMRAWRKALLAMSILVPVSAVSSLLLGSFSPWETLRTLVGYGTDSQSLILFQFRLPRVVIALLIGAGLAISGAILQAVTRNPMAEPGIIGINAGAGFAVTAMGFFFDAIKWKIPYLLPVSALFGGVAAGVAIYLLALRQESSSPSRLILQGVVVGLLFQAFTLFLQVRMDPLLFVSAAIWLTGMLALASWELVLFLTVWLIVWASLALYVSRTLDVISLGASVAAGIGVSVRRSQIRLLTISVMLASGCVAVGGGIAFIGLVAPHIARTWAGANHRRLLPLSAMVGALLLLLADNAARLLPTTVEMPAGILVSALGAPYFLYLLARSRS